MRKAKYNNAEGLPAKDVFVKAENADGTVDLCDEKGVLLIGSCTIGAGEGQCVLVEETKKKKGQE
jgi:hypothetical protein